MGSSPIYGPFRVLFIRVPYYIGDLERDPNLENYPYRSLWEPYFNKRPSLRLARKEAPNGESQGVVRPRLVDEIRRAAMLKETTGGEFRVYKAKASIRYIDLL